MAFLSTDDDARRLRNVWLGGKGFEWGFAARYPAWGMAIALFLFFAVLAWSLLAGSVLFFLLGPPLALILSVVITRRLMRYVTPDLPVRAHVQILLAELTAPRPQDEPTEFRVAIDPGLFTDHRPTGNR